MGRASWIGRTYQRVSGIWATPDDQKAQLPDVLHEQLLEIFHHAEAHGEWPQQLLNGGVHSLEKVANAQSVAVPTDYYHAMRLSYLYHPEVP